MSTSQTRVVVIVEDEAVIRTNLSEALTDAGFNVIEAVDAADALMLLNHGATGIHALVTDNRMPGSINGVKLTRMVQGKWPWINLVVAAQLIESESELPFGCRYFQKPYQIADVVDYLKIV